MLIATALGAYAQEVWLHPNKGQWDDRIEYIMELSLGELFIEGDGFTYNLSDVKSKMRHHHHEDEEIPEISHEDEDFHFHIVKTKFLGSDWKGVKENSNESSHYRNYLIGSDKSKWKSKVHSCQKVVMRDMYDGVDLTLNSLKGNLEYGFEIAPGVDVSQIQMSYEGQDKLWIDEEGNLHVANRFGEVVESAPKAWIDVDGNKRKVYVEFELKENVVSFSLPDGYDDNYPLTIDPNLTFSTFTGSSLDNWGMSATPDAVGNLFGGGVVFNSSSQGIYPTTVGAFSSSHSGGTVDIGITKFNSIGTALFYSTFIGGAGDESVNSMISVSSGDLYIFGATSSSNFPIAGAAFDNTYNGGPNLSSNSNGLGFSGGADIYVARLSSDGTTLIASTYVGGSGADGINTSSLQYNYGDQYRGEIIVDQNENVYVASTTQSSNFPTVQGTQSLLGGTQDAVIFKMTPLLDNMLWSTYYGGSGHETGNSVQISSTGEVYVAGGTNSGSLNIPFGNDLTFGGGVGDGYLARFNGNTGMVISGTFIGAMEYDQAYFVQLDIDNRVYVLGQSESDYGVDPGLFGVANSGQFIRKYSTDLTNIEWTTMIGAGSGHVEISPTAFLVSDCYDIYLSGWGGTLNSGQSQATFSSSNGFPLTPDAYQSATNGSNFYIAVLDQDASNLKYGTYFGSISNSSNHVDGGTSRFDKSGRIYHAVCGSCGSANNGFTTTPGVWAPNAGGTNCNLAAFKFELSTIDAIIGNPTNVVCLPDPVVFSNNSSNGNSFFWDFGDGNTSTQVNPSHLYAGPGDYTVTLVVSDTNGCFTPDSVQFLVHIGDFQGGVVQPPGPICPGDSYQFEAFGGTNYVWTPAQFLDNPNIATPTATVDQTTSFQVIISDTCGVDTVNVTLEVFQGLASASPDTSVCIGNSVQISATGGVSYTWSPAATLDDPSSATPIATPTNSTAYIVEILTSNDCLIEDTVQVDVYFTPPVPVIPDVVPLCEGNSTDIEVSGAQWYAWTPNLHITPTNGPVVTVNPPTDIWYYCMFTNVCGDVLDSVFVDVITTSISAGNDTIICPGETAPIWATGGVSYVWSPAATLNNAFSSLVYATPTSPTMYHVLGTDQYGCTDVDSVYIDLHPLAFIQTVPDVYAFYGDQVELGATSTTVGPYIWSPAEFLSCVACENPIAVPNQNFTYTVTYTDQNGCSASDVVNIFYDPILYVPNTFTPNSDDLINQFFQAQGGNIATFEMLIFDRWGELIHTMHSLDDTWDGTFEGNPCQDGTYTWKIKLTDFEGNEEQHVGHVNLIR